MKGYVYKIVDNTTEKVYYGSTIQQVSQRINDHKKKYALKNTKCKSKEIIKNGNYSYYTIEEVVFENKWELRNRERWYIENNKCVNKNIPNRTQKEYYENNKEEILKNQKNSIKRKEWCENNKEKMKEWYENNKEKKKEYDKKYHEENQEKRIECAKKYYEENKKRVNEKQRIYRRNKRQKEKENN
tara:strand:- start:64 stop:621 length:558 start_codon:yes stop_codon:yes gene_type:complete